MTENFLYPADQYLLLGPVTKVHGLRGEVKIFCYSGQPDNFSGYREIVLVAKNGRLSTALAVEKFRVQGKTVIVQLASIASREQAEEIVGSGVLLAKSLLPTTDKDEYYCYQYEGKIVVDVDGQTIGKIVGLFHNGAQDILVVQSGQREILIPVTTSIIVGETEEQVIIDPPPGLLELGDD